MHERSNAGGTPVDVRLLMLEQEPKESSTDGNAIGTAEESEGLEDQSKPLVDR